MKRFVAAIGAAALVGATLAVPAFANTGNGAPSGAHYNLNIVGVPKGKSANMSQGAGNVIFVDLNTNGVADKIMLWPTYDGTFGVLDKNGTDGQASFELPFDVATSYTVWARALGKPGGSSTTTTCAYDLTDPSTYYCSTLQMIKTRTSGQQKFTNVTTELTTITLSAADQLASGCQQSTVNLFDSCLQDYFWSYDNNGLKLLQIRFYAST